MFFQISTRILGTIHIEKQKDLNPTGDEIKS